MMAKMMIDRRIIMNPFTCEPMTVLDPRGLFRCKHRFMFRAITKDEGSGFMMAASKYAAAHLVQCQPGTIFGWRTDIGIRQWCKQQD